MDNTISLINQKITSQFADKLGDAQVAYDTSEKSENIIKSHQELIQLEDKFGIDKDINTKPGVVRNYRRDCEYVDAVMDSHDKIGKDCENKNIDAIYRKITFELYRELMAFTDVDQVDIKLNAGEGDEKVNMGVLHALKESVEYLDRVNNNSYFLNRFKGALLKYDVVFYRVNELTGESEIINWWDMVAVEWHAKNVQEAQIVYKQRVCIEDVMDYVKTQEEGVKDLIQAHVTAQRDKGIRHAYLKFYVGKHIFGESKKKQKLKKGTIVYFDTSYLWGHDCVFTDEERESLGYGAEEDHKHSEVEIGRFATDHMSHRGKKPKYINNIFAKSLYEDDNIWYGWSMPSIIKQEEQEVLQYSLQHRESARLALKNFIIYNRTYGSGSKKMTQERLNSLKKHGYMEIGPEESIQIEKFQNLYNEHFNITEGIMTQARRKINMGAVINSVSGKNISATEASIADSNAKTIFNQIIEQIGLALEELYDIKGRVAFKVLDENDHKMLHGSPREISAIKEFGFRKLYDDNFDEVQDFYARRRYPEAYQGTKEVNGALVGTGKIKSGEFVPKVYTDTIFNFFRVLDSRNNKEFYEKFGNPVDITMREIKQMFLKNYSYFAEHDVTVENNNDRQKFNETLQLLQWEAQNPASNKDINYLSDFAWSLTDIGRDPRIHYTQQELQAIESARQQRAQQEAQLQAQAQAQPQQEQIQEGTQLEDGSEPTLESQLQALA